MILVNLNLENMNGIYINDVTAAIANTEKLVKHTLGTNPRFYIPIEGNFYVHKMGVNTIDVRSNQTSVAFKLFIST